MKRVFAAVIVRRVSRTFLSIALAVGVWSATPAARADLASEAVSGSLWTETLDKLAPVLLTDARAKKVDDTSLRVRQNGKLTFGTLKPVEILLTFDLEKATILEISTTLYNKGDDGALLKQEFEARLKASVAALNEAFGTEATVGRLKKNESGVSGKSWEWSGEHFAARLEASSTGSGRKYVAEFIRLFLVPDKESLKRGGAKDSAHRAGLKDNVKREEDGTVWITGIPMVDQGEKGYCVPATVSRVFAYYGMDGVDQHALAALCKSSDAGTRLDDMKKALVKICNSFHMRVKPWDWIKPKVMEKELQRKAAKMDSLSVGNVSSLMLETVRKRPYLMNQGFREIKKQIDDGVPVVWAVMLGLFQEQGLPQSMGGHMRLIIGYNEQKQTIIYSDTWGAGHEKKEMPLSYACAMTNLLCVLRPTL